MPARRAAIFYSLQRSLRSLAQWALPLGAPLLPPRARGAGGRAPPAPTHGGWGHSVGVKGPSPRRFAPAGRTNPLTPTPFEVEGGQGSRSDREAAPTLTPWNDPNAHGWWSGGALPLTACHVANGQAPLGGRVSGGSKAKPRRLLVLLAFLPLTFLRFYAFAFWPRRANLCVAKCSESSCCFSQGVLSAMLRQWDTQSYELKSSNHPPRFVGR